MHRTQSLILVYIASGVRSPADIAREMGLTRENVHQMTKLLIESGLVEQRQHPDDPRRIQYGLTESSADIRTAALDALNALTELMAKRTRATAADLVSVEKVGNQKHYQANANSPMFEELAGLVRKTVALVGPLRIALDPLKERIVAAFVYGSIAKGMERAGSDIDLMVIADDIDYAELFAALPGVEATLARTVNPNLMTCSEWQRKRDEPDSFAAREADHLGRTVEISEGIVLHQRRLRERVFRLKQVLSDRTFAHHLDSDPQFLAARIGAVVQGLRCVLAQQRFFFD